MRYYSYLAFSTALAALCAAPGFSVACSKRPGTPDLVKATVMSIDRIAFEWRNTTGKGSSSTSTHTGYFDIYLSDNQGKGTSSRNVTGEGPYRNIHYRSWSVREFDKLPAGTTVCFSLRARSEGGTKGCVSELASAAACATTPSPEQHNFCQPYVDNALSQIALAKRKACPLPGPAGRWSQIGSEHYNWCLGEARAGRHLQVKAEDAWRAKALADCQPRPAPAPVPAPPPPPSPPPAPAPSAPRCTYLVTIEGRTCLNHDGTPSKTFGAGTLGYCMGSAGGGSEAQALLAAKAAWIRDTGCPGPDDDADGDGQPEPGFCTYATVNELKTPRGCQ